MGNKFSVDDLVTINKTGEIGQIISVQTMGTDYNTYVVKVGDSERVYTEDYLSISREKKDIKKIENINMKEISYSLKVDEKINSLIRKLNLEKSDDSNVHLKNACKLMEYLSVRKKEGKNAELINVSNLKLEELYEGLVSTDNNIASSYLFAEILNRIGMKALCVILSDKDEKIHVANLVLIKDLYYYFDLSVERSISYNRKDNILLCCSGLGSKNYCNFFKPMAILNFESNEKEELPVNIATENIDFLTLNGLNKEA